MVHILVLGSGRCGSKSLAQWLEKHGVQVSWEWPKPARDTYPLQRVCSRYHHGLATREEVLREVTGVPNPPGWGEVMVHTILSWAADVVTPHLDPEHVVHLHRDGRDVVRSTLSRWRVTPDEAFEETHRSHRPFKGVPGKRADFDHACAYWAWSTRRIHTLQDVGDWSYQDVSLADIAGGDGLDVFRRVLDRPLEGGFPHKQEQDEHTFPAWPEWGEACRERFDEVCGGMMKVLGYS